MSSSKYGSLGGDGPLGKGFVPVGKDGHLEFSNGEVWVEGRIGSDPRTGAKCNIEISESEAGIQHALKKFGFAHAEKWSPKTIDYIEEQVRETYKRAGMEREFAGVSPNVATRMGPGEISNGKLPLENATFIALNAHEIDIGFGTDYNQMLINNGKKALDPRCFDGKEGIFAGVSPPPPKVSQPYAGSHGNPKKFKGHTP